MAVELAKRMINVNEYHKMAEVGILKSTDRLELLNGEIVYMSPIGSKHAGIVDRLADFLTDLLKGNYTIKIQAPILLNDTNEPEPDITICTYRSDYYIEKLPEPKEIEIVIEVADSSYLRDKEIKSTLYASGNIPAYWIVNIELNRIEVYSKPSKGRYRMLEEFEKGDKINLLDHMIKVEDILI